MVGGDNGSGVALLTHETRFVMALPAACLDPTWRPVCALAKKFRPRRANTWKHPTPLFQRGLLEVAVPEPAEQYSKAAKKNFRRRQNRRARKAAANMEQHLTVAAGVDSRANWTVVKDGDTAVKQTIAVKQTSVVGATAPSRPHKSQSAMSIKTVDDFNYTKIKPAW
ncbi:hypothetical protein M9435_001989 [Picochlorum sp. BPE23]|nr:hypothetical protein M9435_001989 [Picochlorum sp. BPE23]